MSEPTYTFFHEDGPIRLSEHELVNDYMRLRAELEEHAGFIGEKGLGDEFMAWALARRGEIDHLLGEAAA